MMAAPMAARAAGVSPSVLVHEHVLVDFIGAGEIHPGRYDAEEVFRAARPKLEEVQRLGCRRLVECTPNFLGRDARLMCLHSGQNFCGCGARTRLFFPPRWNSQ